MRTLIPIDVILTLILTLMSPSPTITLTSTLTPLRPLGVTNDTLEQLIDDEPKDPRDYAKYISDNTSKVIPTYPLFNLLKTDSNLPLIYFRHRLIYP